MRDFSAQRLLFTKLRIQNQKPQPEMLRQNEPGWPCRVDNLNRVSSVWENQTTRPRSGCVREGISEPKPGKKALTYATLSSFQYSKDDDDERSDWRVWKAIKEQSNKAKRGEEENKKKTKKRYHRHYHRNNICIDREKENVFRCGNKGMYNGTHTAHGRQRDTINR